MYVNTLLALTVGAAGALILGFCIYFDQKRRSDPDYKRKVHERRRREEEMELSHLNNELSEPLDPNESTTLQHFLYEFQMGEHLINQGNIPDGISHLANAVMMFAHPVQGLRSLQETLPKHILVPLIQKLHEMQSMSSYSTSSSNQDYSTSSNDIL